MRIAIRHALTSRAASLVLAGVAWTAIAALYGASAADAPGAMNAEIGAFWKVLRSNPLVFSLVPRCHGLCGSQK